MKFNFYLIFLANLAFHQSPLALDKNYPQPAAAQEGPQTTPGQQLPQLENIDGCPFDEGKHSRVS